METNSSTSRFEPQDGASRDATLRPVWLFVIGVLLIETLLRLLPEGFMTRTIRHRAEEIRYLPATRVQLMGDSVSSGISAARIEQFLGSDLHVDVSNYSLPGTSPMFNYFVLRRQVDSGHAPRVILFAPHPCTWRDPFVDRFLARFADPRESALLLRDGVDFDDWVYGALCRMSFTLRYREELYLALTQGDFGFFKTWQTPVSSVQNTRAKIAPDEVPPSEPPPVQLDDRNLPPSLTKAIAIHPDNELYFDKFCALAARNNIQIVWLTLPEPELFRRKFPGAARTAEYAPFVNRMRAKHANLYPLSLEIPTLPDNHYADAWHLNAYGRWVFSRTAGEQLASWLQSHPQDAPRR